MVWLCADLVELARGSERYLRLYSALEHDRDTTAKGDISYSAREPLGGEFDMHFDADVRADFRGTLDRQHGGPAFLIAGRTEPG